MTSREHKYLQAKKTKSRLEKLGVAFSSHVLSVLKSFEGKEGAFFGILLPTGGLKHADGTYVEVDPKYLKPQQ